MWGLNEPCCDREVNVSSFSAGNLRHKNVTAGCQVNQYGSRGRRLKAGGKERGMLPQVKNKMTAAKGGGGGEKSDEDDEREKRSTPRTCFVFKMAQFFLN